MQPIAAQPGFDTLRRLGYDRIKFEPDSRGPAKFQVKRGGFTLIELLLVIEPSRLAALITVAGGEPGNFD
jgi:hypothetical protein